MVKKLKVDDINTESGTQTRVNLQEEAIADYAEAMKGGVKFPPVTVFHDGKVYYLADGFHRVLATVRNGKRDIEADVRKGSCMDALKYALGANTDHGLRRTNADKRKCVQLALASFGKMSDRAIADMCGVGHSSVSDIRKAQLSESDSSPRTGLDGKTRKLPAKADPVEVEDQEREENINQEGGEEGNEETVTSSNYDNDSPNLVGLKRYYRQSTKKDRRAFLEWIKTNGMEE